MRKKVAIGAKPVHGPKALNADDWVKAKERGAEKTKRLTIDIPLSLHTRVKSQCALQGLQIAEVVREMLDRRFPADPDGAGKGRPAVTSPRSHGES